MISRLKSVKPDPNAKCQKCLKPGHWTADCTGQRIYKSRPTRSALLLDPSLKLPEKAVAEREAEELAALQKERDTAAADILSKSTYI